MSDDENLDPRTVHLTPPNLQLPPAKKETDRGYGTYNRNLPPITEEEIAEEELKKESRMSFEEWSRFQLNKKKDKEKKLNEAQVYAETKNVSAALASLKEEKEEDDDDSYVASSFYNYSYGAYKYVTTSFWKRFAVILSKDDKRFAGKVITNLESIELWAKENNYTIIKQFRIYGIINEKKEKTEII